MSRILAVDFSSVYPHYVARVEKQRRTKAGLDRVIEWLTGFDDAALGAHLAAGTTLRDFVADAAVTRTPRRSPARQRQTYDDENLSVPSRHLRRSP